jgi:DUF1680 family protein
LVNGKRVTDPIDPGTFAAIRRTWHDGDRVELELPMPSRLEPVDVQHSNQMALLRGPLVLFAVAGSPPAFEKAELMRAKAPNANGDCAVTAADGTSVVMRPFMKIEEESYITYVSLKS